MGYIINSTSLSDSVVRHLIDITTKTEAMKTPPNRAVVPAISYDIYDSENDFVTEYTNTGFGHLPVPCKKPKISPSLKSTRIQSTLLMIALVLCLTGITYLLIFSTVTFKN